MAAALAVPWVRGAGRPWRIAHVMSFESPWRWTDGQLAGFQQALAAPDAETRIFLPVRATTGGYPAISLARARRLGIPLRSTELLSCAVVRQFAWDVA